jgi:hypothetical protein
MEKKIDILHQMVNFKPLAWRMGQAYFNFGLILYPEEVEQIRATEEDCFYNDEKILKFIDKLESLLLKIDVSKYNKGFQDCYEQMNTTGLEVQKRAFEGARKSNFGSFNYKYETFEDYLKSLENGKITE